MTIFHSTQLTRAANRSSKIAGRKTHYTALVTKILSAIIGTESSSGCNE
jgi:hypothetical protein